MSFSFFFDLLKVVRGLKTVNLKVAGNLSNFIHYFRVQVSLSTDGLKSRKSTKSNKIKTGSTFIFFLVREAKCVYSQQRLKHDLTARSRVYITKADDSKEM